jgi:hypothetical protein
MRSIRIFTVVTLLALLAASCGRLNGGGDQGGGTTGTTGGGAIEHPTGASDLVLRVEDTGGFVPYELTLTRMPSWSLFGDGGLITQGAQPEIYPGPALPSLLVTRISEEAIQAILRAARDAGLMNGDASYDYPCITDVTTTVFTVDAGRATSVVSAYALGADGSCQGVDREARAELSAFQAELGDLRSWLPEGSVGADEPYSPQAVRVYVTDYTPDPDLPQQPIDWPLSTPLASFGERNDGTRGCGVVSGADLGTLMPDLQRANQLTPWRSEGQDYRLLLRPLLPDEHGC